MTHRFREPRAPVEPLPDWWPGSTDPLVYVTFGSVAGSLGFVPGLTPPGNGPCVIRGAIPPGGAVPLHSHKEPETFLAESGELEGLVEPGAWVRIGPGDVFHVPGGARHAFRNRSREPAVQTVVTTDRIARFFREVAGPSSDDAMRRFLETAERYGYWVATPKENATAGVPLVP